MELTASNKMGSAQHNLLTPTEVAKLLIVSPVTVRHWSQQGKLRSLTTPGGHRRYTMEEVTRFASEHGINLGCEEEPLPRMLVIGVLSNALKGELNIVSERLNVSFSNSAFDAGIMIQSFKPDYILLSSGVQGLDAADVCRSLKEHEKTMGIRIFLLADAYNSKDCHTAMENGAEACIDKTIDAKGLMSHLGIVQ